MKVWGSILAALVGTALKAVWDGLKALIGMKDKY